MPTFGGFVQHRSSEAIPCRNQTAIASDRPLSVECRAALRRTQIKKLFHILKKNIPLRGG
jgi:hypothetical protein